MVPHHQTRIQPLVVPAMLVLALLSGCSSGPRVGSVAPQFSATDTSGRPVARSDYDGRVLLLDFWATWCAPCRTSSPAVQRLHERYATDDRVDVLAIHYDDKGTPVEYMAEHGYTYRVVPDGGRIARAYGVSMIPTFIIVGMDGRVAYQKIGYAQGDEDRMAAVINEQLRTMP